MKPKRNINRAIAIRIRRAHAHVPILWRKRTDFSDGKLGIRGTFMIRMAARWAHKKINQRVAHPLSGN